MSVAIISNGLRHNHPVQHRTERGLWTEPWDHHQDHLICDQNHEEKKQEEKLSGVHENLEQNKKAPEEKKRERV